MKAKRKFICVIMTVICLIFCTAVMSACFEFGAGGNTENAGGGNQGATAEDQGGGNADGSADTVPEHVHTPAYYVPVAATCTAEGKTGGVYCSECGEVLAEQTTVPAAGHKEAIDEAVAATCTTAGKTEGKHCSECGMVFVIQMATQPTGHTVVTDEAVAATCTDDGKTEGSHCSECGEVFEEQTTVPAAHTIAIDEAVAATCTATGLTEGSHCSICKETLVAQNTVPATGHTETVSPAREPTCTDGGKTENLYCSVCQEELTEAVYSSPLGHSIDSSNYCHVCDNHIATPGLKYTLNEDGESYSLTSAEEVRVQYDEKCYIASVYNGKPVTRIGKYAFENAYLGDLNCHIVIPDSVTTICEGAFSSRYQSRYISITIPDSVTKIETYAFNMSTYFSKIYIADIAAWCAIDFCMPRAIPNGDLYLNGELVTDLVIPEGVTSIPPYAFCYSAQNFTSVTIPESLKSIGEDAFGYSSNDCPNLESVYITDKVAWFGVEIANLYADPRYYAENLYINGELMTDWWDDAAIIPESATRIHWRALFSYDRSTGEYRAPAIYYEGTADRWKSIYVEDDYYDITVYYYSEVAPESGGSGAAHVGNYWHYDEDKHVVVW